MNELIKNINKDLEIELKNLEQEDNLPLKPQPVNNGLSEDQNNGMTAILSWLNSHKGARDENAFFALRGSAGTGKTTLIGQLLKVIDKNKYRASRICICAPTHKAKKVIQQKTKWNNSETLQALLGLKLDINLDDFDPNNPAFSQIGDRKIKDYDLVMIDEASMVNADLYNIIKSSATGTMVLFIGDTLQLNPVKELNISLALISPIHSYTLTQIMRQADGNPLIGLLSTLRNDLENNTNNYMRVLKDSNIEERKNSKGEGFAVHTDSAHFALAMKIEFQGKLFEDDKNHCRYISWTNQSITDTNRWLRNKVYSLKDTLGVGEVLLSYKTVMDGDEILLVNSDDYVIEKITETINSDYQYPLNVLKVELSSIDTDSTSKVFILKREEKNYENYISCYNTFLQEAKIKRGKAWPKFFEFKNSILILDSLNYKNEYKQDEFIKKDIDYGYGITIHKSQGSTYNTVFVNGKDINKNPNDLERKRLWYVALSRTSNLVHIIL